MSEGTRTHDRLDHDQAAKGGESWVLAGAFRALTPHQHAFHLPEFADLYLTFRQQMTFSLPFSRRTARQRVAPHRRLSSTHRRLSSTHHVHQGDAPPTAE